MAKKKTSNINEELLEEDNIQEASHLQDDKDFNLEASFERLEEIINSLEDGTTSLDESFKLYKEGVGLVKDCNSKIDKVEKEILIINENGEIEEANGEF